MPTVSCEEVTFVCLFTSHNWLNSLYESMNHSRIYLLSKIKALKYVQQKIDRIAGWHFRLCLLGFFVFFFPVLQNKFHSHQLMFLILTKHALRDQMSCSSVDFCTFR